MAKNLRNIRELAEVVGGVAKARALLRSAGVDCIGDLYDDGSIRALRSEPKVTNIGKTHKNYCTVAETDGFGAMKAVCDAADLDIVRHVYCGMNYLTVRSEKNERRTLKVYTRARMGLLEKHADFTICGFLREDAPKYYMLLCFEGPIAWVMKRTDLVRAWNDLKAGKLPNDYLSAPRTGVLQSSQTGVIRAHMKVDDRFVLKSPAQLGL